MAPSQRLRLGRFLLLLAIILLGLASRKLPLPAFISDSLWARDLFVGLGLIWASLSTKWLALLSWLLAWTVEFSQLLSWPWLVSLRYTTIGHLFLGRGFLSVD